VKGLGREFMEQNWGEKLAEKREEKTGSLGSKGLKIFGSGQPLSRRILEEKKEEGFQRLRAPRWKHAPGSEKGASKNCSKLSGG